MSQIKAHTHAHAHMYTCIFIYFSRYSDFMMFCPLLLRPLGVMSMYCLIIKTLQKCKKGFKVSPNIFDSRTFDLAKIKTTFKSVLHFINQYK